MSQASVKKFLPEHMLAPLVRGKNLPAIIGAVDEAIAVTEELIQACLDQLFLSTASGRFLIQLGEEQGFTMPANSGLDIRAYKVLVPVMVSDPKQVRNTINELIQSFYSSERTKPSASSTILGPYNLNPGDDLIVETENGSISVSIVEGQVSNFSNVSASEIAAVLNFSQSSYLADAVTDRTTGLSFLRITTVTSGASAFIRVAGGKLQNVVQFPNVISSLNTTGTTWLLSKTSSFTDEIKFTWDGLGTNPNVYLAKKNDVITLRGFVDGIETFSDLNGSYVAIDVGYDYFVIRNAKYSVLSSSYTQNLTNNIVFTKNQKLSLYDRDEYALTSETDINTITVTVPAVPPLARRFLAGSWHLHGAESTITDFTRSTVSLSIPVGIETPTAINQFFIKNSKISADASAKRYKTVSVNSNPLSPTYAMEVNDDLASVFPYTTDTLIDTDPIKGDIGSDILTITFPYRHGLLYGWGATLSGATGAGNILAGDLNKELEVFAVVDEFTIKVKLKNASGDPIKFAGISWGPADAYQHSSIQPDGSDFYLQFASPSQAIASGLTAGTSFRLDALAGVDVNPYLASLLKSRLLAVTLVNGAIVNFSAGVGPGSGGSVITGATGKRSGLFGGNISYKLEKTSPVNLRNVFEELKAVMIAYTTPANPLYVGSYLYDPSGVSTNLTVSKFVVNLTDNVLKGDNLPFLIVDNIVVDGENFPSAGNLVLDFGTANVEGPIRYFAIVSNPGSNQILIDPAYKFKKSHDVGAKVQFIRQVQAWQPSMDGSDYQPYITGTTAARNTMFTLIDQLVAAGVFVEQNVVLPTLRYADPAINPFI